MSKNKNMGRRSRSRKKTRTKRKANSSITVGSSVKPSRKTRTKTRKPKYLSLVHLEENKHAAQMSSKTKQQQQKQLNLFPLHPENSVEDRELDHVSLFFNTTEEDNVHAVSLSGLLGSQSSDNYKNETTTTATATATATVTSEESPLSPSVTYDRTRLSLVRSAMKGKEERDESEEKWVVYSEVVDEKKEIEEVSSCCGGDGVGGGGGGDDGGGGAWCSKKKMKKLLALKLDYEEIMNAWSDKGPLYIEGGEAPQTVPDLHNASANVFVDGWGTNSVFEVPEMVSSFKIKEDFDGKEDWRRGHREESVLRYKEKRRNRLFSKRVRYEVRKLNAEKRPRLKDQISNFAMRPSPSPSPSLQGNNQLLPPALTAGAVVIPSLTPTLPIPGDNMPIIPAPGDTDGLGLIVPFIPVFANLGLPSEKCRGQCNLQCRRRGGRFAAKYCTVKCLALCGIRMSNDFFTTCTNNCALSFSPNSIPDAGEAQKVMESCYQHCKNNYIYNYNSSIFLLEHYVWE